MVILLTAIERVNGIAKQIPMSEIEKSTLKLIWKHNRHQMSSKNNAGFITIPDFNYTLQCYWHKNRLADKQNRTENTEINPDSYSHLISEKGAKNIVLEKSQPLTNGVGKTGYPHVEDWN
jgi:hypothetical protein